MSELTDGWRGMVPGSADEHTAARRYAQGAAFHRSGRVTGLRLAPGRLSAGVQGARATPYHVEVLLAVLHDADWRVVVDVVAGEVRYAASLLAGRWPDGLLDALADRGVELLGAACAADARCPCGEAERPCPHLVALWEAAAERFAAEPFAFLHLRGRGRQRLLADLSAARRAQTGTREDRLRLDALPADAWTRAPSPIDELDVPPVVRPDVVAASLRLLGDPPGWAGAVPAYDAFAPLVAAAARRADQLTRGKRPAEPDPPPS